MKENINTPQYWDGKHQGEIERGILRKNSYGYNFLKPYLLECNTFLDLGCSTGSFIKHLLNRGISKYSIYGADFSDVAIDYCKKVYDVDVFKTDLNSDFEKELASFDMVTCFHTIEHLENPQKAILNLVKITKKILIVALPLNNGDWCEHLWDFSEEDIKKLFENYPNVKFYKSGLILESKQKDFPQEIIVVVKK